jgi:hypothetical protein
MNSSSAVKVSRLCTMGFMMGFRCLWYNKTVLFAQQDMGTATMAATGCVLQTDDVAVLTQQLELAEKNAEHEEQQADLEKHLREVAEMQLQQVCASISDPVHNSWLNFIKFSLLGETVSILMMFF